MWLNFPLATRMACGSAIWVEPRVSRRRQARAGVVSFMCGSEDARVDPDESDMVSRVERLLERCEWSERVALWYDSFSWMFSGDAVPPPTGAAGELED